MKNKFGFGGAVQIAFAFFAFAMVFLAMIGGINRYSPIPFGDMWSGTLGFFLRVQDGDYSAWWAQHNEHRIVLARMLFWLDFKVFGGMSYFLIASNYVIAAGTCYIFYRFILGRVGPGRLCRLDWALIFFVIGSLFLWTQDENFTWAFQSQFFFAQLLPLAALYWLARSVESTKRFEYLIACLFGVLAVGTMANGVLIFPLMAVSAWLMRQGKARVLVLVVLSALVLFIYFADYQAPYRHGHLSDAIKGNPLGLVEYVLLYLGGVFYFLCGMGVFARYVAIAAGGVLLSLSLFMFLLNVSKAREKPYLIVLLVFVAYVVGTACGTGGGRLVYGVDQALSFRYTTPSIMAWCALIVALYVPEWWAKDVVRKIVFLVFASLAFLMLKYQTNALVRFEALNSIRSAAVMALNLGIADMDYIREVSPNSDPMLISSRASALRLSVFGRYPLVGLREQIGEKIDVSGSVPCVGAFDRFEPIAGVGDYVRVHGWLFDPQVEASPALIRFIGRNGEVIGFAQTGTPRPDVAKVINSRARKAGFVGYVKSVAAGGSVTALGDAPRCNIDFLIPREVISLKRVSGPLAGNESGVISEAEIVSNKGFDGADFQKTTIDGLLILGSFIAADSDVGRVRFMAKKGESFYYRSGPTAGRQILKIPSDGVEVVLPASEEWVRVVLDSIGIEKTEVEVVDAGQGWGEWSAIGLKKH